MYMYVYSCSFPSPWQHFLIHNALAALSCCRRIEYLSVMVWYGRWRIWRHHSSRGFTPDQLMAGPRWPNPGILRLPSSSPFQTLRYVIAATRRAFLNETLRLETRLNFDLAKPQELFIWHRFLLLLLQFSSLYISHFWSIYKDNILHKNYFLTAEF